MVDNTSSGHFLLKDIKEPSPFKIQRCYHESKCANWLQLVSHSHGPNFRCFQLLQIVLVSVQISTLLKIKFFKQIFPHRTHKIFDLDQL